MVEASDGAGGEPLILYDLTLLAASHDAPTASGIPGVDLNLASYIRKRYAAACSFIVWAEGEFWVVPGETADLLLSALSARWFGKGPPVDGEVVAAALRAAGLPDGKPGVGKPGTRQSKPRQKWKPAPGQAGLSREYAPSEPPVSDIEEPVPSPVGLSAAFAPSPGKRFVYVIVSQFHLRSRDLFVRLHEVLGASIIVYLHDLIPIEYPEYTGRQASPKHHKIRLVNAANYASLILCNSEYVRNSLISFYAANHMPVPDIAVCRVGSDHLVDEPAPVAGLPETYFMMIGTIEGRKNHISMLHLWRDLVLRGVEPPKLCIVGRRGWASEAALTLLDRSEVLRGHVVELNDLETGGMLGMLVGARALLFPSFEEGWGMPLIEALRLGVPAICSDIPALREAGQGVPDYVSPIDLKEWERRVLDYAKPDSRLREEQLRRLAGFTPPEWADAFRVVDQAIAHLVARPTETTVPRFADGADDVVARNGDQLRPAPVPDVSSALEEGLASRSAGRQAKRGAGKARHASGRRGNRLRRAANDYSVELADSFRAFLRLVQPQSVSGFGMRRVGGPADGGYVMIDDLANLRGAISAGIGDDVSWDLELARAGVRVTQVDHTVDGPPLRHENFDFRRQKLVPEAADEHETTLAGLVDTVGTGADSLVCKIDVEGDEWAILASTPLDTLRTMRQLVVEFHRLDRFSGPRWRQTAEACLRTIAATHQCVHIHGNNSSPFVIIGATPFPKVFEATFASRSAYTFEEELGSFPTDLDCPNDATRADLYLGDLKF